MEREWWMDAKIYELYADKFADNFDGLTRNLDYFTFLGVNTLHVLPHYPSPLVDDGYDVSDYKAVRPRLGTLDDFKRFTEEAHKRNLRIVVDLVLNHVSDQHPWFKEARASKGNTYRDYFVWSESGVEGWGAPNPFPDFKTSNWIRNDATSDFYHATFYPEQPDFNWKNPAVLAEFLSIIDFWVQNGVDGFRLDAAPHLLIREGPLAKKLEPTHGVLKHIRAHIDAHYRGRVMLLAEVGGSATEAFAYFGDGDECHMVYHFDLMREMWLYLLSGDRTRLDMMISASYKALPDGCQWATFLRNHDEIALDTMSSADQAALAVLIDPHRTYPFRGSTTSAVRLGTIFEHDEAALRRAIALLYALPGAPVMYYGDEIGMKNLPVQQGILDSRRYVRGAFDWALEKKMRDDSASLLHHVVYCMINRV